MREKWDREIVVRRISKTEAVITWEDWQFILSLLREDGAKIGEQIMPDFSMN